MTRARARSARRRGSPTTSPSSRTRLEAVGRRAPRRRRRGRRARRSPPAASGCARCSSSSPPPGAEPPVAAGVAVELVHLATLVHDDLIDGARLRRGRAAAWSAHGPTPHAPPATTSSRARSPSSPRPATRRRSRRSRTRRSASRAARRCSARSASTRTRRIDAYLERCALKTGKLFEAACLLARRVAAPSGSRLGIAFQIADDILDCAGETIETGKIAGHRPARGDADAAAAARRAARTRRVRAGARRRAARGRARPRCRDRRARAVPRGRP